MSAPATSQRGIFFLNGVQIMTDAGILNPATPSTVSFTFGAQQLKIYNRRNDAVRGTYTCCMLINFAGTDVATIMGLW